MRWSLDGSMLASASQDNTAKLLDFTTGKVVFTGTTRHEGNLSHLKNFASFNYLISRNSLFSLLYLKARNE